MAGRMPNYAKEEGRKEAIREQKVSYNRRRKAEETEEEKQKRLKAEASRKREIRPEGAPRKENKTFV